MLMLMSALCQTLNSMGYPASDARASPDERNTRTATIYTTNDMQRSVDSFNVPVSAGGMGNSMGPVRGQTIYGHGNQKMTVLVPTGYTGAAEAS